MTFASATTYVAVGSTHVEGDNLGHGVLASNTLTKQEDAM